MANTLASIEELGASAFLSGAKCAPIHDRRLYALIVMVSGDGHGPIINLLDAWSRGWHRANLAA